MALEAVQAQAGHRSIESTRIYLHLADRWLADEYHRAIDALDGDLEALIHAYLVLLKTGKTVGAAGADTDDLD